VGNCCNNDSALAAGVSDQLHDGWIDKREVLQDEIAAMFQLPRKNGGEG
jgi:hypothetical protein